MSQADRASRDASITLGVTLPTDTVLYLLLPLFPDAFGVTLAEAGVLLAANRIVRIVGYGWVAAAYQRRGPRTACMAAVIGAAASSLGYALLPANVGWLLLARLLWGLSFAAMNIAVQALPTAERQGMARRSGRSRAIIAVGPTVGLIAAGVLSGPIGPRAVFIVLGIVALAGMPFAMRLPSGRGDVVQGGPRFALPSRLDTWSFVQGMALDGVFILGLAVLARAALPEQAGMAAAAALALRYVAEIVLGPPGGALAERVGAMRLLVLLSCASAAGLAAIGFGALWTGAVGVMLLRGLIQPLPAPVAAAMYPGPQRVPALARLATWRDLGAGLGPLVAGLLLPVVPPYLLYTVTAAVLVVSAVAMWGSRRPRTGAKLVVAAQALGVRPPILRPEFLVGFPLAGPDLERCEPDGRSKFVRKTAGLTMPPEQAVDIETTGTRLIYENRWMRLREDQIRRRDGSPGIYSVVEKPDFVVIAPVENDGRLHLVQQYRYPVQGRYWELPQGAWELTPDADPAEIARGELQEETGLTAVRLTHAGHLFEAYGYANQGYHIFLATGLSPGLARPEQEEQDLVTRAFPMAEVERMIRDGEIKDATTVAAVGLLRLKGLL